MRPLLLAVILPLTACKTVEAKEPCEFDLRVRVTANADEECRALGAKWRDDGKAIKDTDTIRGCAPKDRIITNGTESNMGHEMKHHIDRNCR